MNDAQLIDFHDFEAYLKSRKLVDDRHLPPFRPELGFCALLFLMREVLGRDTACLSSLRAKSGPHLPVVFSAKVAEQPRQPRRQSAGGPGAGRVLSSFSGACRPVRGSVNGVAGVSFAVPLPATP
jgi:hypothetical protein